MPAVHPNIQATKNNIIKVKIEIEIESKLEWNRLNKTPI